MNFAQIKIASLTRDNVTYTVDATNGIITAVVSGTHTQDRMLVFNSDTTMYTKGGGAAWQAKETETAISPNGKYKIWGNPSPDNTRVGINGSLGMYIYINKEVSSGTFVFKPMITVASYNGEFVPYAMSNKELTEYVEELSTNPTKLVTLPTSVSIFDVFTDGSSYPRHNTYWKRAQDITNGSDSLSSLLGVDGNAIVRIDRYDSWYISVDINDLSHNILMRAWCNQSTTTIKFMKIDASTSPYISQVTLSKATT